MTPALQLPKDRASREKVLKSMARRAYLNVWEGAVRSGKTVFALAAFALYVIRSSECSFLLSGRTVKTIEKNCILEEYGLLNLIPGSEYRKVGESRAIVFTVPQDGHRIRKTISVYGASDSRAYMAIRGNTYAGWFADEINMHDKEFVLEALKRTAVSKDRAHYWTLNPDTPRHWVYTEFLDRYAEMSASELEDLGGFNYWHFTPYDNPAMTEKMYKSLMEQYPEGYLRDRYIRGLRVIADGLIYPNVTKQYFRKFSDEERHKINVKYCAIDYGANHPTVMLFGGFYNNSKKDFRIIAEYYDKQSEKTTYEHYLGFMDMCEKLGTAPHKIIVAIDPAALVLRTEFIKRGVSVIRAKNDVLPGIDYTRRIIQQGAVLFDESCKHTLEEFGIYSWDPNAAQAGNEKPIKLNDDCMDSLRYLLYTHVRPIMQ